MRYVSVLIFLTFYSALVPDLAMGWTSTMVRYSIQDAIKLSPSQIQTQLTPYEELIWEGYKAAKSSRTENPQETWTRLVSQGKEASLRSLAKNLGYLTSVIFEVHRPEATSRYFLDVEQSPGIFICQFDGADPLPDFGTFLEKRDLISVRFDPETYHEQRQMIAATTQKIYDRIVNDLVDVWREVFQQSGLETGEEMTIGTERRHEGPKLVHQPLSLALSPQNSKERENNRITESYPRMNFFTTNIVEESRPTVTQETVTSTPHPDLEQNDTEPPIEIRGADLEKRRDQSRIRVRPYRVE